MMYRKEKNEKDVLYILEHLRADDLEEVKASNGENWKEIVFKNIMDPTTDVLLGVSKENDIPVCMGGAWQLDRDPKGIGLVWMLCTDDIVNHKVCLLKELKKEFRKYDQNFWFMYNSIHSKNIYAKKWLMWLGFKFDNPHPFGMNLPKEFEFFYKVKKIRGLEL